MTRHIMDHSILNEDRHALCRTVAIRRSSGEAGLHPAIDFLSRRAGVAVQNPAPLREFLRIQRERTA